MRTQQLHHVGNSSTERSRTPGRVQMAASRWERAQDDVDVLWEQDSLDTLPELEREIGMSDWLDPDTGEPAEGLSTPHLGAE